MMSFYHVSTSDHKNVGGGLIFEARDRNSAAKEYAKRVFKNTLKPLTLFVTYLGPAEPVNLLPPSQEWTVK